MFGFVVTYYNSNPESQSLLEKTIDVLSRENFYLVLASHSPIPEEIQTKCDYVIFESQNIIDERKYSHGVAENSLIRAAFSHLRDKGILWSYKICYDVNIVDINQFEKWVLDYKYQFVTCKWGECSIATHSFFASVDFILNIFLPFETVDEMFQYSHVLEFAWEKIVKEKGVSEKIYSFPSKESFFGNNKMDIAYYNYDLVSVRYDSQEHKFYIKNSGEFNIEGSVWVYDYFTDLCLYKNTDINIAPHGEIWVVPPFVENLKTCQNGFYIEIDKKDSGHIKKNLLVRDFNKKHSLAKKFRLLKKEEVKYNEYCDFKNFNIYKQIQNKLNPKNFKTIIDIGANFGFFSYPFFEAGVESLYLVDADPHNIELLNKVYVGNNNVKVCFYALCDRDGTVDFYHHEGITVISSLNQDDVFGGRDNRTKISVSAITPDTFFTSVIKEKTIDLLKVDIEGAEYTFFDLISDRNLQRTNNILVEFHKNKKHKALNLLTKLAKNNFDFQFIQWSDNNKEYELDNEFGVIYATKL